MAILHRSERGMRAALSICGLVAVGLTGCARVPAESVELSVTVGRDLAELRRAHQALAVRYFDRMRNDVEVFVGDVYRPYIIRSTMEDLHLVDSIRAVTTRNAPLDAVDLMEIYVEETLQQIAEFRKNMLAPIEQQQARLLGSIDTAFQQLQNANAIVTGHLASVRKVHDAQEELLRGVGAPGLSDRVGIHLADLSDNLAQTLQRARKAEGLLEQGAAKLPEVKAILDHLPGELGRLSGDTLKPHP